MKKRFEIFVHSSIEHMDHLMMVVGILSFSTLDGCSNFIVEATEQTMALEEQWMENTGEMLPDGCK